jgi:DNA-directed RNA polymerase subunit RPC12/RpoP
MIGRMDEMNGCRAADLTPCLPAVECGALLELDEATEGITCRSTDFVPVPVVQLRPIRGQLGQMQQRQMLRWRCARCSAWLDAEAADVRARAVAREPRGPIL